VKTLILDQYEAVIPDKAKQLVMMLGRSRSEGLAGLWLLCKSSQSDSDIAQFSRYNTVFLLLIRKYNSGG